MAPALRCKLPLTIERRTRAWRSIELAAMSPVMNEPNADAVLDQSDRATGATPIPDAPRAVAASLADQLPTMRMPSISPELPPVVPPPRPSSAAPTQPPGTRGIALPLAPRLPSRVGLADSKPRWWQSLLSQLPRAAARSPFRAEDRARRGWSRQRIGVACGVLGLTIILSSIAAAYLGMSATKLDNPAQISFAVAVVMARAAIAIAAMGVGYLMLRMAERLSFPIIVTRRPEPSKAVREP